MANGLKLDHLVVSGSSLEIASNYVEEALGVRLDTGGKHKKYGTHNKLLGLSNGLYLEAIGIDPKAPKPRFPRWFDLDNFTGVPRITNWICQCDNFSKMVINPADSEVIKLSRGVFNWRMSVPKNGKLPLQGIFPALIQWENTNHPSQHLTRSGCTLKRLTINHPEAEILNIWATNSFNELVNIEKAEKIGFYAEFDTPNGVRSLE